MSTKILTKQQAEAVYSAMCALSKVGVSRFQAILQGNGPDDRKVSTEVFQAFNGGIVLELSGYNLERREHYDGLPAFATAYGLI